MMSWARIATGLIVMLAVAGVTAGCGGGDGDEGGDGGDTSADLNLVTDGTLMIGVPSESIPPKYAKDFSQGFELEMAEEIAERLGLTPKVVDTPLRPILQDLSRGKFDIVAFTTEVGTEPGTADRFVISNAYLEVDQKEYGFPVRSALAELAPGETTTQEFTVGEKGVTGGEPLLDAVNQQLDAIIADGTYQSIFEKWFKRKPPERFQPPD